MRKTGRHTFVIDGNYFLFRTLYVLPRKSKKKELLGTEDEVQTFMRKLATDFAYQIRLFEGLIDKEIVNRIVLSTGQTFLKLQKNLYSYFLSKV